MAKSNSTLDLWTSPSWCRVESSTVLGGGGVILHHRTLGAGGASSPDPKSSPVPPTMEQVGVRGTPTAPPDSDTHLQR